LGHLVAADENSGLSDRDFGSLEIHIDPTQSGEFAPSKPVKQSESKQSSARNSVGFAVGNEASDLLSVPGSQFGSFPSRSVDPDAWIPDDHLMLHSIIHRFRECADHVPNRFRPDPFLGFRADSRREFSDESCYPSRLQFGQFQISDARLEIGGDVDSMLTNRPRLHVGSLGIGVDPGFQVGSDGLSIGTELDSRIELSQELGERFLS
jgi:hypothetical protein